MDIRWTQQLNPAFPRLRKLNRFLRIHSLMLRHSAQICTDWKCWYSKGVISSYQILKYWNNNLSKLYWFGQFFIYWLFLFFTSMIHVMLWPRMSHNVAFYEPKQRATLPFFLYKYIFFYCNNFLYYFFFISRTLSLLNPIWL